MIGRDGIRNEWGKRNLHRQGGDGYCILAFDTLSASIVLFSTLLAKFYPSLEGSVEPCKM